MSERAPSDPRLNFVGREASCRIEVSRRPVRPPDDTARYLYDRHRALQKLLGGLCMALLLAGSVRAGSCDAQRFFSLPANDDQMAATIETLFTDVAFAFDREAGLLTATGCPDRLATIESVVNIATAGDAGKWQQEMEQQFWGRGGFRHAALGFGLRRPLNTWQIVSVFPDGAWVARLTLLRAGLKMTPLFGLTLVQGTAKLTFVVLDADGAKSAKQVGEADAALPPPSWPYALRDATWRQALAGPYVWLAGTPPGTTKFSSLSLWTSGSEKIVCDRAYVAQPAAQGDSTRLYLFMLVVPQHDWSPEGRLLANFTGRLSLPMAPPRARAQQFTAVEPVTAEKCTPLTKLRVRAATYQWQCAKIKSPEIQAALRGNIGPKEEAAIWEKLLPALRGPERAEALWGLSRAQLKQGRKPAAEQTLAMLQTEFPNHPLAFEAAIKRGTISGQYLQHWDWAEMRWQEAVKLAKNAPEQREAAFRLATVLFYRKQYEQAMQAFDDLLQRYPSIATADFVHPYLWYMKNCLQKKL